MRVLIASAVIALLAVSAHAQDASGKGRRGRHIQTAEQPKKKVDDAAYKAALKGIPNQQPSDPWGSVRSAAH
jgi:hypothetical protein